MQAHICPKESENNHFLAYQGDITNQRRTGANPNFRSCRRIRDPSLRRYIENRDRLGIANKPTISTPFPSSTRGNESIGAGGFIGRAIAMAVGYGIIGPRLSGDTYLEFEEKRRKRVELLEETEAVVNACEEKFVRKSKS